MASIASMARCSAVGPILPKRVSIAPKAPKQVAMGQIGVGLGLAAAGLVSTAPPRAEAAVGEIVAVAEAAAAAGSDNRGQLLLIVVTPAILWVLYNILQPALNQINKMRSK